MNCRSAESLFSAFLDDALNQAERRSFESHLLGCRRCSASLREFKATLSLLGDAARAPVPEVGPHFDEDLMARIRSGEAMRPSMIEWLRGVLAFDRLRPALAAGATVCVLVVAVVALWPSSRDAQDAPAMASSDGSAPAAASTEPAREMAEAAPANPVRDDRAGTEIPARAATAAPAPATLAASGSPAAVQDSRSEPLPALRPLVGDEANGIIQVVDRIVPGTDAALDSALPNPNALFADEYVTDQFYLQRTGTFIGPRQPTSVPVSDRGSDDAYIEF